MMNKKALSTAANLRIVSAPRRQSAAKNNETRRISEGDGNMEAADWTNDRRLMRQIAEQAPFMIWLTDQKGYCFYLNPAWVSFTGQAEEDGHGDGWTQMVHPEDRDHAHAAFFTASAHRRNYQVEYRLRVAGNGYRWVAATGRPLINEDGGCDGYVGTVYAAAVRETSHDALVKLSPREVEVLQLAAIGKTSDEIAIILAISARTVEAHINSALVKTNSVNKVQAVVAAIKSGQIIV
jgi:PAS domain S-box-containing protein